jgi:CRP-like cAMP-binding protein
MIDESLLDSIPFLRDVNAAARREIAARSVLLKYAPGETIFLEGTKPPGVFVVLSGKVRVMRDTGGRQHVVHEEDPGGTLSELPVFEGGTVPATAIAGHATECILITQEGLWAAIAADSTVAEFFLRRLAARVRTLVERLDRITSQSVAARLALLLLERGLPAGKSFTLGGTQVEIAEELGTVREVVARELARLRKTGVLGAAARGRLVILDADALAKMTD